MNKADREKIRHMFDEKCAYCGKNLDKTFHIDHVKAIYRGWDNRPETAGEDEIDNMFPACPRCNIRKGIWSVEEFREEILYQVIRLRLRSSQFRLAEDYGMIIDRSYVPVTFWFEKYREANK